MTESRTVSISIKRRPEEVYEYLVDPANFPKWSIFIKEIKKEGSEWIATTPERTVRIRFTPRNEFRVLDHYVTVSPQLQVYVPMRVLADPENASEVIFTVFRSPGMTDEQYKDDIGMVLTDLAGLKRVLEDKDGLH
jgi:uncharacterized protein YndB with AHSA1/START domain